MRFFQLSRKNLALLNEALQVLNVKEVQLMIFFSINMVYLLTAYLQAVHLVLPICDVMASADLKRGERLSFTSLISMIIMHVLADMEELFLKRFLQLLDGDKGSITECHLVCTNLMKF